MLEAQLLSLDADTTRTRQPPWVLEVGLLFPRPGIDERVRFREINEIPKEWDKGEITPDNFIFRERVDRKIILIAKLRREKSGFAIKLSDTFKSLVGQFYSGQSPLQWYTIRDLLNAGERIAGVRERIRAPRPPDMQGHIVIEAEEFERQQEIELKTLEPWENPDPKFGDARDRDYQEILVEEGDVAGKLNLKIKRG